MSNASLGTNFSDIWINIQFVYKIMRFKISSAKWRPFRPGLNAWNHNYQWDAKLIQIKRAFDKSWKMPRAHRGCFCPVMLGLYVTRSLWESQGDMTTTYFVDVSQLKSNRGLNTRLRKRQCIGNGVTTCSLIQNRRNDYLNWKNLTSDLVSWISAHCLT